MNEALFTVLANSAFLAGLWWLWFFGYKGYRIDHTRQELFEIRDALFDYWDEHGLDFDNQAYRTTWDMLNATIRFAHRLSLYRLIINHFTMKKYLEAVPSPYEEDFDNGLKQLDRKHRDEVMRTVSAMHVVMLRHAFLVTVLGTLLGGLVWVAYKLGLIRVTQPGQQPESDADQRNEIWEIPGLAPKAEKASIIIDKEAFQIFRREEAHSRDKQLHAA